MSASPSNRAVEKVTARSILTDPLIGPIIGIVFVFLAGFGLVFPVMPLFARSFGVGNDGAGLLVGAFGFARLFGDLIGGSIVDRKGERWTAIVGMVFLAICASATAAASNFVLALVFWGLAGVGSAIVFASLFSYILKAAPSDRVARTLSFFYGAFNIGVIAGGAAGGFIADAFGLAAPLFAYSIILVVSIVVYLRFVPVLPPSRSEKDVPIEAEAAAFEAPRPSGRIVRDLLRVPGFLTVLFLNLAYLWIIASIFNTIVPLFATDEIGMSPGAIGAMFAVGVAAEFIILFPAGSLSDRYGRKAVVVPSLAVLVVMTVLLGTATSALMLTLLLTLLAFSSGFAGVPPAAMLSDIVPTEHSGRGVGAFRFAGDIGFFLGPLIAGAVSKSFGFQTAFVITAIVPAIAVVLALRTKETMRREPRPTR
ncbi:MAG: MFS transporter [Actinobacteria bacterium]|nr:MFS transporter [Actinomycetota bacterium]